MMNSNDLNTKTARTSEREKKNTQQPHKIYVQKKRTCL